MEEIKTIIDWYLEECHTAPIESLLKAQDKLSVLAWRLAEQSAEVKKQYNASYFIRKIEVNRSKQGLMNSGKSGTQSEAESIVENEDKHKTELELEAMVYKMDLLLRQTNKVISAMAQRISYAKIELNQT